MARADNPVTVAFTGGEIDDYALARIDLAGYESCAETLLNVTLTSRGAMELAPGTLFVGVMPGRAVLRDWKFSTRAGYCLELSENLVRWVFGVGYVTLAGGAATVGTWTDQSAAPPAGGAPAPAPGPIIISIGGYHGPSKIGPPWGY